MNRLLVPLVTVLLALMLGSSAALAANPHYKGGEPDCSLNQATDTVRCTGALAGVGNQDVTVLVTAIGTQEVFCRNPGGNIAPGQTQNVSASGSRTITPTKNGNLNFDVSSNPPAPASAGCPNSQWTVIPGDVTITGYTLQFFQGGTELTSLTRSGSF